MRQADLKAILKEQAVNLEDLVLYLEDCGMLEMEDYQYCQAKIHEVLEHLKQLAQWSDSAERA